MRVLHERLRTGRASEGSILLAAPALPYWSHRGLVVFCDRMHSLAPSVDGPSGEHINKLHEDEPDEIRRSQTRRPTSVSSLTPATRLHRPSAMAQRKAVTAA